MIKKLALATVAVFVAWGILDFVIHGVLLAKYYQESQALWRPMEEMKMWLIYFTSLVYAFCFVFIYTKYITDKQLKTGLYYGLTWGIGAGIGMGYGSYASMPMPYAIAFGWFAGTVVEMTVAGVLVGLLVKAEPAK